MRSNGIRILTCRRLLATGLLLVAPAASLARPVVPVAYNGSTNAIITFGVADYGAPIDMGLPTYLANNVTGRTDILTSPGGGALTAHTDTAHNIVSYPLGGPGPIPVGSYLFGIQSGGTNQFGQPFGSASAVNYGTSVGVSQYDFAPAGGTASYTITSWTANYTSNIMIPAGTTYGTYIAMQGTLPAASSASVMALRTFISSPNAGDPFFGAGAVDLPQLVLAFAGGGTKLAIGGQAGNTAAILSTGLSFRGFSVDSLALALGIPAGDTLNVTSTLTVITDPSSIEMFSPDLNGADNDLYMAAGSPPLPGVDFITPTPVPEPGTLASLGVAATGFAAWRRKKRMAGVVA